MGLDMATQAQIAAGKAMFLLPSAPLASKPANLRRKSLRRIQLPRTHGIGVSKIIFAPEVDNVWDGGDAGSEFTAEVDGGNA